MHPVLVSCAIALETKQLAISNAKVILFIFVFHMYNIRVNVYCKTSCGKYSNGELDSVRLVINVRIFRGMF